MSFLRINQIVLLQNLCIVYSPSLFNQKRQPNSPSMIGRDCLGVTVIFEWGASPFSQRTIPFTGMLRQCYEPESLFLTTHNTSEHMYTKTPQYPKPSLSSQVVGLRTRVASIRTLIFSSPDPSLPGRALLARSEWGS